MVRSRNACTEKINLSIKQNFLLAQRNRSIFKIIAWILEFNFGENFTLICRPEKLAKQFLLFLRSWTVREPEKIGRYGLLGQFLCYKQYFDNFYQNFYHFWKNERHFGKKNGFFPGPKVRRTFGSDCLVFFQLPNLVWQILLEFL